MCMSTDMCCVLLLLELHNSRRSDNNMSSIAPEDRPFIFRINDNGTGPVLLIQVIDKVR